MNEKSTSVVIPIIISFLVVLNITTTINAFILSKTIRGIATRMSLLETQTKKMSESFDQNRRQLQDMAVQVADMQTAVNHWNEKTREICSVTFEKFDETLHELEGYPIAVPGKLDEIRKKLGALSDQINLLVPPSK